MQNRRCTRARKPARSACLLFVKRWMKKGKKKFSKFINIFDGKKTRFSPLKMSCRRESVSPEQCDGGGGVCVGGRLGFGRWWGVARSAPRQTAVIHTGSGWSLAIIPQCVPFHARCRPAIVRPLASHCRCIRQHVITADNHYYNTYGLISAEMFFVAIRDEY